MAELDGNEVLLAHLNGIDGARTYTADTGQVATFDAATGQLDTAQYKFSPSSILFDGNSDFISFPHSANWDFGSGNFKIDAQIRFASLPSTSGVAQVIVAQCNGTANRAWNFYHYEYGHVLAFGYSTTGEGQTTFSVAWTPNINTWYHVCITRVSNVLRFFVDGTQVGDDQAFSATIFNSSAVLTVGKQEVPSYDYFFNGWIDELHFSKGGTSYETSNFTSPTTPYGRSINTLTSDANVKNRHIEYINSNAYIKHTHSGDITSDSKVVTRIPEVIESDATITYRVPQTIESNANVKGTLTKTILSNTTLALAHIEIGKKLLSDAIISHRLHEHIESNASIKGTLQDSILSDAKLVNRPSQNILSDTAVKHIEDNQILADGKVVYRRVKTRIADATIRAVKYFYGQIQARVESSKAFNAQLQVAYPTPINPTSLIATDPKLGDVIFLTWAGSADNVGYNVYKDVGGNWIKQNQTLIYDYQTTVGELVTGLTYNFKVVGVNGEGLESAGATASGTPTFDIQYRTNPTYAISGVGAGYILDSIELVYGPSFCTASFHKNIRPTEEALQATGQSIYIQINGRYVFGGYLFKREDVWSSGAIQVNFTIIGFSYYFSTYCREQDWPPAKKDYIAKFDEDALVGNTELEARAAIAAYHGAVLYSSPISMGLYEYKYGSPVCQRWYTLGKNILEENLITDETNKINSVTAVSDFSQYTKIKPLGIVEVEEDTFIFKTTAPNRAVYPFPLHKEVPSPKNTAFGTILTPFKTKDDIKGFYFSLSLGGFNSEISNVRVQALTNKEPKITKFLQIMEEVPALSEGGTDYGFTKWITTGNVEFTPMDLLEKRYNRVDPITEEEVSVAHPWRDGSFSSKPAIVSYEEYPLEWKDVGAAVDYAYDKTGKTAYIVLNSVPVRYKAEMIEATLEREIFDSVTADLKTEVLTVTYEEDPDQYIAEMRVLYTYKGERYSYTVGSGRPNRYIVQGITPIFNEEDEEYGLPGDNSSEVMDTLIDAANTEFHKVDLPLREGSLQILGDETLDLRTTINGLEIIKVHHSFNDGFRTSLELSIPQSEYASTLHILNKDKERKRENELLNPIVSTLEYDVDKIKNLFGKAVLAVETNVKPDSSLSTYA